MSLQTSSSPISNHVVELCSFDLCSYNLCSFELCSFDLCSFELRSFEFCHLFLININANVFLERSMKFLVDKNCRTNEFRWRSDCYVAVATADILLLFREKLIFHCYCYYFVSIKDSLEKKQKKWSFFNYDLIWKK